MEMLNKSSLPTGLAANLTVSPQNKKNQKKVYSN